jgi:hypothetical protein
MFDGIADKSLTEATRGAAIVPIEDMIEASACDDSYTARSCFHRSIYDAIRDGIGTLVYCAGCLRCL